ncbi:hypothetical protein D6853_07125 [Butyrivibrio sp. X503]|uniref:hypothetical protein n=1 Tax=Butyrivibrio sp. X503 TaxID=2364878 RepID=UPI000EA8F02E|nr:hypothetical protein [Butyrivibrio sp. X503]RKM56550.1 hypothetical protein D6853_07125 [Butyrivibrio sp. X503]
MVASIGLPGKLVYEPYYNALKRYGEEVYESGGKTLSTLNRIGKNKNLPDYSEMIDKWLAKQEQYFDYVGKVYHYTDGKDPTVLDGSANFTAVFIIMVETGGPMDVKDEARWHEAFGKDIPYPPH